MQAVPKTQKGPHLGPKVLLWLFMNNREKAEAIKMISIQNFYEMVMATNIHVIIIRVMVTSLQSMESKCHRLLGTTFRPKAFRCLPDVFSSLLLLNAVKVWHLSGVPILEKFLFNVVVL